MKISIFSDAHCGYDFGGERGQDAFEALDEAMEKSLDSDLIIMAGDMFDTRIPRPEVFAKVSRILSKAQNVDNNTKVYDLVNKDKNDILPTALRGIPVVGIHGTHERRSKHMVNPMEALEHAGLIIHLHCGTAVFDINGNRVAVHGMSGVPERYAGECLKTWNPKPIPGAKNIFVFHQSIEPYIYSPLDPPTLKLEDLPDGFDLYVLGHIHWSEIKDLKRGKLLLTGSLIPTSIHKSEAEQRKGVFFWDGNRIEQRSIKQRRVFMDSFTNMAGIKDNIERRIQQILVHDYDMKPIINIKIRGKVPKGEEPPNFYDIAEKYSGKAIINFNKKLVAEGFKDQMELLQAMKEERISPEEQGMKILRENLSQSKCRINADDIFDLLVEGNVDSVYGMLIK